MVVVDVAYALAFHCSKSETRSDRAIGAEPPLTDVPIPTGLHFANQHHLVAENIDGHPEKIARIGSGVENCQGRRSTEPKTWCNINTLGLNHPFLILPIAIRAARICVVLNVENWDMGSIQHTFSLVI